jgi:hypothetical protein
MRLEGAIGTEVSKCVHCTLAFRLLLTVREALLKTLAIVSTVWLLWLLITGSGSAASVAPTSQALVSTMLLLPIAKKLTRSSGKN